MLGREAVVDGIEDHSSDDSLKDFGKKAELAGDVLPISELPEHTQ